MALFLVPIRDNQRLMDDAIPIDETEIFIRNLLECYSHACRNDKMPGYRKFLSNYTNIPRTMKLSRDDITTDEWSFDVSGLRDQTKINDNQTVASFYQDGGKTENKVLPYATLKLVVGSEIEFRPPPQHRKQKCMRHLKFRVVAADAEANVVDDDDVVEEEEAAEVVDADTDADDGDKEAVEEEEEQSVRFP